MKTLSIVDIIKLLLKNWKIIVACIIGWILIVSTLIFSVLTPQYSSSTQMLVNTAREGEVIQGTDIDTDLRLMETYKEIIRSPVILDDVRDILNLQVSHNQLKEKITVSSQINSQIITIEVRDESNVSAANIANTISETFQENIVDIMNIENVTIISSALASSVQVFPNVRLSILLSVAMGFMNGVALVFLLDSLDKSIKNESFISEQLNWIPLGQINEIDSKSFRIIKTGVTEASNTEKKHIPSIKSRA